MWSALIYVCFHLQGFVFCLHHLLSTHTLTQLLYLCHHSLFPSFSKSPLCFYSHVPVDPADCISFFGFSETGFCTLIGIQVHMSCLPVYLPVLTVCLPTCQLVCLSFSLFPTFPQSKITKRCYVAKVTSLPIIPGSITSVFNKLVLG